MHVRLHLIVAAAASVITCSAAAQTPVSTLEAHNEAVIRRHHDAINRADVTAAAAFYSDKLTNNGNAIDRARITAVMADNQRTFPDWNMRIDRLLARGNEVVALITVTGTHKGVSQRPVNGGTYLNAQPTGRRFSILHTHWFRLKEGLIVDHRATRDDLGMARQLGLLPPSPPRVPDQKSTP